jgi:sRNA-binding protein
MIITVTALTSAPGQFAAVLDGAPVTTAAPVTMRSPADTIIMRLAGRFPACFHVYQGRRKPLKIGIHEDIRAALNGEIAPEDLGASLRRYTSNDVYLDNLRTGTARIDLNGKPAGLVTTKEALFAQKILDRRKKQHAARKKTASTKRETRFACRVEGGGGEKTRET